MQHPRLGPNRWSYAVVWVLSHGVSQLIGQAMKLVVQIKCDWEVVPCWLAGTCSPPHPTYLTNCFPCPHPHTLQ
jgi:hypothetical protein